MKNKEGFLGELVFEVGVRFQYNAQREGQPCFSPRNSMSKGTG